MRMLDLYSGLWGWGRVFAARGWEVVGVDLTVPPEIPDGCTFIRADVMEMTSDRNGFFGVGGLPSGDNCMWQFQPDFICASSPCENFSVFGMKCFHPNPPYPSLGIDLFNHTRSLCENSGLPYVMENVRTAQQFVGNAVHHCGPFYLWGTGVPPLMPQGITKGMKSMMGMLPDRLFYGKSKEEVQKLRRDLFGDGLHFTRPMKHRTAIAATIPPELANCVVDYAERLLEAQA